MDVEAFKSAVQSGLTSEDWEPLEEWITHKSSFSFREGRSEDNQTFDARLFDYLLFLLQESDFLQAEGASNVLFLIEDDWSLLSSKQKEIILPELIRTYPLFKDPMAWFAIAELLGEYFADENAFRALQQLKNVKDEEPRSLVPMGFEQIVRHSSKELATRAFNEIIKMREDDSEQVRMEANISLNRLAAQDLLPFLRQEEQE